MIIKQSFIKTTLSLVVGASLVSLTPEIFASQSRPLIAGQTEEIGIVQLYGDDNDRVRVDYTITEPGWCLNDTHLYVGENPPASAAPGSFPFKHEGLGCTQFDSFFYSYDDMPLISSCGYVAAHGVVVTEWSLPIGGEVTYKVSHNPPETNIANLFHGDIWIDGEWQRYLSHCVDLNHRIYTDTEYTCTLYSSLDLNAPVDKPYNLDSLNYLLNHQDEYKADPDLGGLGLGPATRKDIIAAIWGLIEDKPIPNYYLKDGGEERINFIVQEALDNDGFEPGSDEIMGIIVYCGARS